MPIWWSSTYVMLDCAEKKRAMTKLLSEKGASLHLALPALEALHKAWSTCSENPKYKPFQEALQQGVAKIHKYYNQSSECDAYIIAMLLYPSQKDSHIKQFWGKVTHAEALKEAERIKKSGKVHGLLQELSSDDESSDDELEELEVDPQLLWLREFYLYLNSPTSVPNNMSIIQWWGAPPSSALELALEELDDRDEGGCDDNIILSGESDVED
ncbi:hypothetical protein BDR04DRAFT_1160282 [Suillus decipiens]|nr:hypothetical protein BDR04DRAFT_1160282 [Suillus decipiens]